MSEQTGDCLRLLVADDDREMRRLMRTRLERAGFEVVLAENGPGALEGAQRLRPDLLVLDVNLSGMDGFEVLRLVRDDPTIKDVPVLLLTARTDIESRLAGLGSGADDYMIKPCDLRELLLRVKVLLSRKTAREGLVAENERLARLADQDPLTGAYNRRSLEQRLREEAARSSRFSAPLSVCMLDLDHFKRVNDTYGHPVGDKVLVELVRRIGGCLRTADAIARYGGEEFLLVLPHTNLGGAVVVAERIRYVVGTTPFDVGGVTLGITVSIGAAEVGPKGPDEAVVRADAAMYRAKQGGRNRVETG